MTDALDRGLRLLELLAERGDARLADLVTELGTSRATAFRDLATLQSRGYVEHTAGEDTWRLGHAVSDLAAGSESSSLLTLAAPALADLRATSRETVNLATLHRNRLVWAASFDGAHALRLTTTIGEIVPVHATAIGKAVLSALPEQDWARLLPPEPFPEITPATRRSTADLAPDVAACRERGWALDLEESEASGICVASPILGRRLRPVGAISVSSVAGRCPPAVQQRLGDAVRRWCEKLSADLRSVE